MTFQEIRRRLEATRVDRRAGFEDERGDDHLQARLCGGIAGVTSQRELVIVAGIVIGRIEQVEIGGNVVVIGGGDTAIDAARVSKRVTIDSAGISKRCVFLNATP